MPASKRRRRSSAHGVGRPGGGTIRVATLTRISTDETNQPYSLEAQAIGLEASLRATQEDSLRGSRILPVNWRQDRSIWTAT